MWILTFLLYFLLFILCIKKGRFYKSKYVSSSYKNGDFIPGHEEINIHKIPPKIWIYLLALLIAFIPVLNILVLITATIWRIITIFKEDNKIKDFFNKEL